MANFQSVATALLLTLAPSITAATFTVTNSAAEGPGTLNQALLDANANPGLDQIRFAVPTATLPPTGLPGITGPVDIDGLLPSGQKVQLLMPVELDLTGGFVFEAGSGGSSLRNVVFMDFTGTDSVVIAPGATGVTLEGNTFRSRVSVLGNSNTIQDNTFRNLLLFIDGDMNVVLRNVVGHIGVSGDQNEIGRVGAGNTITFLRLSGTGNRAVGNTFPGGIEVAIFGTAPLLANTTIASNRISQYPTGVRVMSGSGFTITANSISNTGIPIDLGGDGPTPNDPAADADTGGNNLQNFPLLTSATLTGGSLTVSGTLASVPLTTFTIELFSNTAADPDARTFLGAFDVTTDAAGNATFSRTVAATAATDDVLTSTATNRTTGDTSEVSAPVAVDAPGTLAFSLATYPVDESAGSRTIVVTRSGGAEGTVTVQYATQNGTATSPGDFIATSGTLTFGPGVTAQTFVIPIVADATAEREESFTVTLSAPTGGAVLGTPSTAAVVIAGHAAIPTASTWALLVLALALAAITLARIGG